MILLPLDNEQNRLGQSWHAANESNELIVW